jgi:hypothetical protein
MRYPSKINSWKGGEQVGRMDSPSFIIPYLWDQRVLFDHSDFPFSPNWHVGAPRRTLFGRADPPHGGSIEKDSFKKSFGKFYRIDSWSNGRQSHLQRLSLESIQPSANHPPLL